MLCPIVILFNPISTFFRISATDGLSNTTEDISAWTIEDTVKLAGILAQHGVDLIDVSDGGNYPVKASPFQSGPIRHTSGAYQARLAEAIRKIHGPTSGANIGGEIKDGHHSIYVGAVGGIRTGEIANDVLTKGQADVVFVGRQFQKDPGTVWAFAEQLGVQIKAANQIQWGFWGTGSMKNWPISALAMKGKKE